MPLDPCSDEELTQFGQMVAWCRRHKKQIHCSPIKRGKEFIVSKKPMKRQKPSWEKQAERRAIDALLRV